VDNADRRLMKYGYEFGLIDFSSMNSVNSREELINQSLQFCSNTKLHAREINGYLKSIGSSQIDSTETISKLCKRPELNLKQILSLNGYVKNSLIQNLLTDQAALEQVEIELKYEGYIKRQYEAVNRFERYEETRIPSTLNYLNLKQLSAEGKEKLNRVKPRSIGQASRISGVTPSDISVLLVYLKN
jgi:tRNA uridine 5-carboxymethylaminomethyl modification enzyme